MRLTSLAASAALAVALAASAPVAALAADASVSGVVTLDGGTVAGTEVGWFDPATGAAGETITDGAGAYAFTIPAASPYVIYAGLDHKGTSWLPLGGASYTGTYVGAGSAGDTMFHTQTPFPAGVATVVNVALGHPGTITGTNAKLANRTIKAVSIVGDTLKQVKSDSSGTYVIDGLIPGRYQVKASSWLSPELVVGAGATVTANPVVKTTTGTLKGKVTLDGKPVAKLPLYVACNGEWAGYATTTASGRYTFSRVTAGKCEINISRYSDDSPIPGSQPYALSAVKSTVKAKKTTTANFSVKLAATVTASVTLTKGASFGQAVVYDAKGTALGGAYFQPQKGAKTLAMKIQGLPTGTFTLLLTDDAKKYYAQRSITVKQGTTTALGALRLATKTLTLTGTVKNSGGQTATHVSYAPNSPYLKPYRSARIKNGKYTIRGLLPGRGTLQASGKTLVNRPYFVEWTGSTAVTVKKPTTRKNLTAHPEPLYGRHSGVLLAGGAPVRDIFLRAVIDDPDYLGFGNTIGLREGVMQGASEEDGIFRYEVIQNNVDAGFVKGAPFWLTLTPGNDTFASKRGTTVDIGTVTLVVNR